MKVVLIWNFRTHPEFDGWAWVDYWQPMHDVVFFKRNVYKRALTEFAPVLDVPIAKKDRLHEDRKRVES